jgi:hypothetical protein
MLMWHFGSGLGHVTNTVVPSQSMDTLPDIDHVDREESEEEAVRGSMIPPADSDLPRSDVVMNTDERDEEVVEAEDDDSDIESMYLSDSELVNDDFEEDACSDDDGYASL